MTTIAAPVIENEMDDWVKLGGRNLGIVGDINHNFGFHLGAEDVPFNDYSRLRDPEGSNGPFVDWRYACAGDFGHDFDPSLMREHRRVLNNLMNGDYPMTCEFIGKPWGDRPVLYWARWNGIKTLQRYTGSGHDRWSHISWYRSRVDEAANLWTPKSGGSSPNPTIGESMILPCVKGDSGIGVKYWQEILDEIGKAWNNKNIRPGKIDGEFGDKTQSGVNAYRKTYGLGGTHYITYWTAAHLQGDFAAQKTMSKVTDSIADVVIDLINTRIPRIRTDIMSAVDSREYTRLSEVTSLITEVADRLVPAIHEYVQSHKEELRGPSGEIQEGAEITISTVGTVTKA